MQLARKIIIWGLPLARKKIILKKKNYTEYSLIGKRPESMSFIRVINCQSSTMRQNK